MLSPYLFNIIAEMTMREALENFRGGFKIGGRTVNNLRYADDIVLITTTPAELQALLNRIRIAGTKYGLVINKGKTKVMATEGDNTVITVDGDALQQVDHFQYLGALITEDGRCESDIRTRLGMAKSILTELEHIWKSRAITTCTKLRLLRSLVWPVGTYGAESWSFGKWEQQKLQSFETICYRRVMRIPWTARRRNEDILEEVGGRKLWSSVISRKLRYFGHIMRKEDDNLEKCIITGMVEGSRGRGRPRRAWCDDIKDWTHLSTDELLQSTKDRAGWRSLVCRAANVCTSE